MIPKILKVSTVVLLFTIIGVACQDDVELLPLKDKQLTISEQQVQGCKENLKSTNIEKYIELKAEGENQLRLKFINATMNCGGLDTTSAFIQDGILKVVFVDRPIADCICYFDLECVVDSMENREYDLEVYVAGDHADADFSFTYSRNLDRTINITND